MSETASSMSSPLKDRRRDADGEHGERRDQSPALAAIEPPREDEEHNTERRVEQMRNLDDLKNGTP